jgi:MFS family permease
MSHTLSDITENVVPSAPKRAGIASSSAWWIWGVSLVFVLFQFFLQLSSGEMVDGLMKSFSLTALGGGVLASSYYYIYVVLQAPAGMMIDHFGPRRILGASALLCAVGCLFFAGAHHLIFAILGRLMMGMGAAFAFVGSLNLVARWFPLERFGVMAAISETVGMLGSLFGGFMLADLIQHIGWRPAMLGATVVGLLIALLLWLIVRDAPTQQVTTEHRSASELWKDVKALIKRPIVWWNGLYSGAMFSTVTVFVALWGIPFIQKAHHLNLIMASLTCNLMFVGVAIGSPVMGWIDGRFQCRRQLMVSTAIATFLLLCLLIYVPSLPLDIVMTLMLLLGFFASSYIITFVIANEIAKPHTRGTSMGFVNMLSVASAPIFQTLIGFLLFILSGGVALHEITAYSVFHFQIALSVVPLLVAGAAVVAVLLPERCP